MGSGRITKLLDSVIVIDHLNGIEAASNYLRLHHSEAAISVITRAEVLAGVRHEDRIPATARLLDQLFTYSIDAITTDLAAHLRRQFRWKLPDAMQAAIAQRYHLQLVTRNLKDFPPERYPFVTVPYTP